MFANTKFANTARSQKKFFSDFRKSQFPRNIGFIWWYFENFRIFSENPKLANTARSQTNFRKSPTPGNLWSIWWYFENFRIFSENKKLANTARSFDRNNFVFSGLFLSWMKKLKNFKNTCELLQHSSTFFVSFLKG